MHSLKKVLLRICFCIFNTFPSSSPDAASQHVLRLSSPSYRIPLAEALPPPSCVLPRLPWQSLAHTRTRAGLCKPEGGRPGSHCRWWTLLASPWLIFICIACLLCVTLGFLRGIPLRGRGKTCVPFSVWGEKDFGRLCRMTTEEPGVGPGDVWHGVGVNMPGLLIMAVATLILPHNSSFFIFTVNTRVKFTSVMFLVDRDADVLLVMQRDGLERIMKREDG